MGLPDRIELRPLPGPVTAQITVPGSKSITNRALILAALADGITTLRGALWSEDTQVMVDALRGLGFTVEIQPDPDESANRTLTVHGTAGALPRGGTSAEPLPLFVGNAGTAARFLAALVCLGDGVYRLSGVPRMHERPQSELFQALRDLGHRIDSDNDRLPAVIHASGRKAARVTVAVHESSQFASALLLVAPTAGWEVSVHGANPEEMPYVEMTRRMVAEFPRRGGTFLIEPDASSGSYFLAADALWGVPTHPPGQLLVRHWPTSGWQADAAFPRFLPLPPRVSRASDLADSILTAMVLAPWAPHPVQFTDLGRLRVQECERVAAMREELTRCGARVEEADDTLTVHPGRRLHGAEIETYRDHRIAMCFAILGLRVAGIRLRDPGCVRKTFPNFFAKLAAPPPDGLGIRIVNPDTGEVLCGDALIATP